MDEYYYNKTITSLLRYLTVEQWVAALQDESMNKDLLRGLIKIQDSEFSDGLYEHISLLIDIDDDDKDDIFDKKYFGVT